MECLLCTMWTRMPYAKKYTTPTTVGETEGCLVVGYWIATRQAAEGVVVRLCERHMTVVNALDAQDEARKLGEAKQSPAPPKLEAQFQQRLEEVNQRKEQLIASAPQAPPPVPFALGPGPLASPNTLIEQPIAPVQPPPQSSISTGLTVPQQHGSSGPTLPMGSPANIVQAAALIDAPCLFCKVMVMTGEVHNCPLSGAKGN
jgi:hypothetical protein